MKTQVVNHCQGPHYIQLQPEGRQPGGLLILSPGLNLVDAKVLGEHRKKSETFNKLFSTKIAPSKATEANPQKFGKPMLEVVGKELPDDYALKDLPHGECARIIGDVLNTDILADWLKSESRPDVTRLIHERIKAVASEISSTE